MPKFPSFPMSPFESAPTAARSFSLNAGAALSVIAGLLLSALPAQAVDIDTARTEPIRTSQASGEGTPDDIVITADGSIAPTDGEGVAALTLDSDNSVTINSGGSISFNNADTATAIQIDPGFEGDVVVSGALSLLEDYERAEEPNEDGAPRDFAEGEARKGLNLTSGGRHTGDITFASTSDIQIEGNDSVAINLGSELAGKLTIEAGSDIVVIGDNARGVVIAGDTDRSDNTDGGPVSSVELGGTISVIGEGSSAVEIRGDIDGDVVIDGVLAGRGFFSTVSNYVAPSSETDETTDLVDRIPADNLLDNSDVVSIGGSLGNGLYLSGSSDDTTTASITSLGTGAALSISPLNGDVGDDIVLGAISSDVHAVDEGAVNQGLINYGAIGANGLNVSLDDDAPFEATAIWISGGDNGERTIIENGILNEGTISAQAFKADAWGLYIADGSQIGTLDGDALTGGITNNGTIVARVDTTLETATAIVATAITVEDGADLAKLTNTGAISAFGVGDSASAVAISVENSTLTQIENTGDIVARINDDGVDDNASFTEGLDDPFATALDLSGVEQGVTLSQSTSGASIVGDIYFGAGDDVFTLAGGIASGDVDFGEGVSTFTIDEASFTGDLVIGDASEPLAGGARHMLALSNIGVFEGEIDFAGQAADFSLSSNSRFTGSWVNGADVAFSVDNAIVELDSFGQAELASLSVTNGSTVIFNLDSDTDPDSPYLDVSGAANLGAGVEIQAFNLGRVDEQFSMKLIEADTLTIANFDTLFDDSTTPWIYDVALTQESGETEDLVITYSRKKVADIGFDLNQANAFGAVLDVAASEGDFADELFSITDQDTFLRAYDTVLPQRTNASTRFLESQSNAVFGLIGERLALRSDVRAPGNGFWAQEFFTYIEAEGAENMPGFEGNGFGFTFGYDRKVGALDAIGVTLTIADAKFEEDTGAFGPVSTTSYSLGAFVSESIGPVDVQLAGQYGTVDFLSERDVEVADYFSAITADWSGVSQAAAVVLSSELGSGRVMIQPRIGMNYFRLEQDAYEEQADLDEDEEGFGLAVALGEAETDRLTASTMIEFGYYLNGAPEIQKDATRTRANAVYSTRIDWLASLNLGYRHTLSAQKFNTSANFVGFDRSFDLSSPETFGESTIVGASLSGIGELAVFRGSVQAELSDEAEIYSGNVSVRFLF